METRGVGRPCSPLGTSIDLVLDAKATIHYLGTDERKHTEEWARQRQAEVDRRLAEDTEIEMRRHRAALERIRRRHQLDTQETRRMRTDFLTRIEATEQTIYRLESQMAAQLTCMGFVATATPELVSMAMGAGM